MAATFDGYPMANKGEPGRALVLSFVSHFFGAVLGVIMLSFFAPIISEFALRFGPAEIFAVMMLTFSAFVGLGGKDAIKTCVSIFVGFLLSCVGMDTVTGALRLTYGSIDLMGGFNFIVAVIGLFGLGEIFLTVEEGLKIEGKAGNISLKGYQGRNHRSVRELEVADPRMPRRVLDGTEARRRDPRFLHGVRFRKAGFKG